MFSIVEIIQIKYLNNLIKQEHPFIKNIIKSVKVFKAFHSAKATLDGIEAVHMIRKRQLNEEHVPAYQQFRVLSE